MKRRLVSTCVILLFATTLVQVRAQQAVVVNQQFDYLRQGSAGVMTVSGPDVVGAVAVVMGRTYPFFPTNSGYASLLAVPLDQKIQDYPLTITLTERNGSTADWNGTVKVASGGFILEDPYTLPADKVYLVNEDIQRHEDERLLSIYSMVTPARYWEGAFTIPVNGGLSSPFGSTRNFNGLGNRRHTGQDFHATSGTPVLASATGRVVFSRALDIHGESVIIDHGWGVFSEYSHLSQRFVVPGQFVLQGDVIGLSGSTGRSTGPHVHWEIAVNGIWVNPITFLDIKLPS